MSQARFFFAPHSRREHIRAGPLSFCPADILQRWLIRLVERVGVAERLKKEIENRQNLWRELRGSVDPL